jgi:hypothetical protein
MRLNKHPELYRFIALSLTIITIVHSAWLFGSELFSTFHSKWRPIDWWQANLIAKFDFPDVNIFGPELPSQCCNRWGGLIPESSYESLLILTWPIIVGVTALMWWKAAGHAEKTFEIGLKLTAAIILVASLTAVGFTALNPSGGGRIESRLPFLQAMVSLFDWLILFAILLGTTNFLGTWGSRLNRSINRNLWIMLSVIIAYLGAYLVASGGTATTIIFLIFISTVWLAALYRTMQELSEN